MIDKTSSSKGMIFKTIAVVGAGTMGAGIAQLLAQQGFCTLLHDPVPEALARGVQRNQLELEKLLGKGKITHETFDATLSRLSQADGLEAVSIADLVIEAVPEKLELKRDLFARLEQIAPQALLATNTSTLSVSAIAGACKDPSRVLGLHFFNPAPLMPLVEVIAGDLSDPELLEAACELVKCWGKTPLLVRDTPGFVVNRIARPFYGEALRILAEHGQSKRVLENIDRVMRGAGFRLGPFELIDLIGLDVNLASSKSVYEAFFHDPKYRPSPVQEKMVASGRLGRKSGRGFYEYGDPK